MSSKKIALFVLLILTLLSANVLSQTYRKPFPSLPVTFNPKYYIDGYSIMVASQIYDRLFDFDELLNIKPKLVESWTSSQEGRSWTLKLRNDVYFHNGKKLDASDVAFTLKKLLEKDSIKRHEFSIIEGAKEYQDGKAKDVSGIKIIAPDTIQITLTRPFPPFLSSFGAPNTEIVPNNYSGKSEAEFSESPIGTGPFKFAEYKKGVYLKLIANDKYFLSKPKLGEIIFELAQPSEALKGFNNGYYQDLERYYFPSEQIKRNFTTLKTLQATTSIIVFNARTRPFDNVHFRKAIVLAFDKQKLYGQCFPNQNIATSIVPPGLGGYAPDTAAIPFNLEKAKEELKLAKLTPDEKQRTYVIVRPYQHPCQDGFGTFFEESMKKIGLNFKIVRAPFDEIYKNYIQPHKYNMYNLIFTADNPEALFILNNLRGGYDLSTGGVENKKIDALLDQASSTENKYDRFTIYKEIQKIYIDNALVIPLYHEVVSKIYQADVRGVVNPPLTDYIAPMWPIYFEEKK